MKVTEERDLVDGEAVDRTRKRRRGLLFVVAALFLFVCGVVFVVERMQNPVNEIDVTQLAAVKIYDNLKSVELDANPQTWSRLVENFQSSLVSIDTAKWPELARVTFEFRDGSRKVIHVYDTGRQPGCFRIGRLYYTGGDERTLIRMMDDEAKRQKRKDAR